MTISNFIASVFSKRFFFLFFLFFFFFLLFFSKLKTVYFLLPLSILTSLFSKYPVYNGKQQENIQIQTCI